MADKEVWEWQQPRYNMRSAHWLGITNLGSVIGATLRRARLQLATPPIVDLPLLYGSSIS